MNYKKYFEKLIIHAKAHGLDLKHYENNYYIKIKSLGDCTFSLVISSKKSRTYGIEFLGFIVELYINNPNFSESYLEQLEKFKDEIEDSLGKLEWQKKEETVKGTVTRVYSRLEANIEDESKWDEYIEWQINTMEQFLKVFPKYTKDLQNIIKNENEENRNVSMKTKNIMLYGAPGVGKTHNYKKLISQIEEGKSEQDIFKSISKNEEVTNQYDGSFEKIKDEKRVEFVTFHQSYSYEDFIEGFRPKENGNIEIDDGIFKLIATTAKNQIKETTLHKISFDEAFDIFRTDYIENELDTIYSVSNVEIFIHEVKEKTIKVQSSQAKDHQYVKKSDLETVVHGFLENKLKKPSDIKKLDVKKDTISLAGLYYPIAKRIMTIIEETKNEVEDIEKNFYIVIDEINRGNISKIFGELITLIEEDKRDTYEVTLPYSKEKFKIPSNLYIIATMNSTDKSIATIDIALRRRFTFLKMKPNPALVKNDKARLLMEALNGYIETHLNEDFKLGHSYFMKIESQEDLEFVKEYKIKPLVEEYFYADDEKLHTALEMLQ